MIEKIHKTDAEWKQLLTPEQYEVLRKKGTEAAFSCAWERQGDGMYVCAACSLPLFHSESKFESGTGWPSYFSPVESEYFEETPDDSYGMIRTEVSCACCGGHLGHVFDDGPRPTGQRYCINSVALRFEPSQSYADSVLD